MKRLLLVSTSRTYGTGYLEHCQEHVVEHFRGIGRVLFVPFALADHDAYAATARGRFEEMGFALDSLHEVQDARQAAEEAEGIFIGGGNTFRLLKTLYDLGLVEVIRRRAERGMPYMGTSAGTNVACVSIKTTNDMPIVYPPTFDALGLAPFNVNPHYLDPDPGSKHMGETRETRIREFHEENDPPVVGLREGAMLRLLGGELVLFGRPGGRMFRKGKEARELAEGTDLSYLLA